jgi:hypothetical protein
MRSGVLFWALVTGLVGAAVAGSVLLSERDRADEAAAPSPSAFARGLPAVATPDTLVLVRRGGGVPADWAGRLERAAGVRAVAEVARTEQLLRRSERADGAVVDEAPERHAFPLDALVVDPRAYAELTPPPDGGTVTALRSGQVLLSRASAELRRVETGDRLVLAGGRTLRVAGVVGDDTARGAEVLVAGADVPRERRRNLQLVASAPDPDTVARALPVDDVTRVAALAPAGAPRSGIARPVRLKRHFGEFAVRLPYGEDRVEVDPSWVREHIVTREVPVLGRVTCHREMVAPLTRAMEEIRARGLERLVDPGDYAGCFSPGRIPGSGTLSLHAWGLAFDINATENPQGAEPRLDRRIVAILERHGFAWGGRWPTAPDGMHFELHEPQR